MSRLFDSINDDLRGGVLRMGGLCEAILEKAIRSLNDKDVALAEEVQVDDLDIDRLDLDLPLVVAEALFAEVAAVGLTALVEAIGGGCAMSSCGGPLPGR